MTHIVVSISGHGYGHVAQTAPILNRLYQMMPQLQITVRTTVQPAHLNTRIHAPFNVMRSEGDIGMVMSSALEVRVEESCRTYHEFHAAWDMRVDGEARLLHELGADYVLSNVGYLPLAGAQRAGIANAALCSLNWFDIYRHYCGDDAIAAEILKCYTGADAFLRATPGMAMSHLPNLVEVAPIAEVGNNRRSELNRRLRLSDEEKLVLVSMGGISGRLPMDEWPRIDGVRWLVQANWNIEHPDAIVLESLNMGFGDLLASSDALLCKPGYGSFTEAACSNTPVMYIARPDWPESPALIGWLQKHGVCCEIALQSLERGEIAQALESLWHGKDTRDFRNRQGIISAGGAVEVAEWLVGKLDR